MFDVPQFELPDEPAAASLTCTHAECTKMGRQICASGHEQCNWHGCNDDLHRMAGGPGGWIPGIDDRPLGNTD